MKRTILILMLITAVLLNCSCREPAGQDAAAGISVTSQLPALSPASVGQTTKASQRAETSATTIAPAEITPSAAAVVPKETTPAVTTVVPKETTPATAAAKPEILKDILKSLDELADLSANLDDVAESDLIIPEA